MDRDTSARLMAGMEDMPAPMLPMGSMGHNLLGAMEDTLAFNMEAMEDMAEAMEDMEDMAEAMEDMEDMAEAMEDMEGTECRVKDMEEICYKRRLWMS